jgi:hypothetical protein
MPLGAASPRTGERPFVENGECDLESPIHESSAAMKVD